MVAWILENTLTAAALAMVVALVCRLNRNRPALCHFLWLLAFAALVMPPLPLGPHSPGTHLRRGVAELLGSTIEAAAPGGLRLGGDAGAVDRADDPRAAAAPTSESIPLATAPWIASVDPAGGTALLGPTLSMWMAAIWVGGGLALLLFLRRRIRSFHRTVRAALPAPACIERAVGEVAERLGVRPPRARLLAGIGCPSIWCYGPAQLLWPATDESRPVDRRERALIAHELAHLRRRDHWVCRLEVLAMALLWWNPVFWLIRRQVGHYAELASDAWALWAYPDDRRAYAEALIDAQERSSSAIYALQGLCATDTAFQNFERRLSMIMKQEVSRGVSRGAGALAILATLLVLPGLSDDDQKGVQQKLEQNSATPAVDLETLATARRLMGKAEKLYAAVNYGDAGELYRKVLALEPGNGLAHGRLGYMLIVAGEYPAARKHFTQQVKLGYDLATGTYNLACAEALDGEPQAALGHLHQAVARGFTNTELMAGDPDLASIRGTESFAKALELARESAILQKKLKLVDAKTDPETALELQAALCEILTEDGQRLHELGVALLLAGHPSRAVGVLERQAKLGHAAPTAYYNLACAHALQGDSEAALKCLQVSAKLGMSHAGVAQDADLVSLHGDPRFEAASAKLAARELRAKELDQLIASGRIEAALAAIEELLDEPQVSQKTLAWAHYQHGVLLLKSGMPSDALGSFQRAAAVGYDPGEAAFHVALAQASLGRDQAALANLDHALVLGFADSERLRGMLDQWQLGDAATREELLLRAAELSKKKSYEMEAKQKAKQAGLEKRAI